MGSAVVLGDQVVDRLDLVGDHELVDEIRRHQRHRGRLAGLDRGLRLEPRVVVAAGIGRHHLDIGVGVVEALDQARHLRASSPWTGTGKVEIDLVLAAASRHAREQLASASAGERQGDAARECVMMIPFI